MTMTFYSRIELNSKEVIDGSRQMLKARYKQNARMQVWQNS